MKTNYVIKKSNLPTRLPILQTAVCMFMMDYYNSPGWVWGMICTLHAILWGVSIYSMIKQKEIDIFVMAVEPETMKVEKTKFQERVEQALKEKERNKNI